MLTASWKKPMESFLYQNNSFFNISTRKLLCESLIFPSLEYCSPSWYPGLSPRLRDSLSVFKRKCERFTLGYGPRSHVGVHGFRILSWMPFSKRVTYFNLLHAYKIRSGCSALYWNQSFTPEPEIHSYNLRQSRFNFSLAFCNTGTDLLELLFVMQFMILKWFHAKNNKMNKIQ